MCREHKGVVMSDCRCSGATEYDRDEQCRFHTVGHSEDQVGICEIWESILQTPGRCVSVRFESSEMCAVMESSGVGRTLSDTV